jgi:hypothetical protein
LEQKWFASLIYSKSAINKLKEKILELSANIPEFKENVELLCSHPEVKHFSSPKKLVAFLGVDTSVSQSGAFTSTHNKLTKRGSNLARKILYNLSLASIKTFRNGVPANPVLLAYYKKLTTSKPKKIAICAIMHKLINHFFAILRDKKAFELRLPETHKKLYLERHLQIVI